MPPRPLVSFLQKLETEMKAVQELHDVICLQECAAFAVNFLIRGGGVLEGWQMRRPTESIVTLVRKGLEVFPVDGAGRATSRRKRLVRS